MVVMMRAFGGTRFEPARLFYNEHSFAYLANPFLEQVMKTRGNVVPRNNPARIMRRCIPRN